jgi:hypothetical protein
VEAGYPWWAVYISNSHLNWLLPIGILSEKSLIEGSPDSALDKQEDTESLDYIILNFI